MTLPKAIAHYLVDLATQRRCLAYLKVTPTGKILSLGGQIEAYGLAQAKQGDDICTHLIYLKGFFPHHGDGEIIPHVHIEIKAPEIEAPETEAPETERTADIHFVCAQGDIEQGDVWLLLLESTAEMQRQRQLQQKGNDLVLLQQAYARLLNQQQQE